MTARTQSWLPSHWDHEADVVVLGTGGAGMVAAIVAHDADADVLIVEKTTEEREGGNTRVSGNGYISTTSVTGAFEYVNALCRGTTPEDVIGAFVEYMALNNDYVRRLGGEVITTRLGAQCVEHPLQPGAESITINHVAPFPDAPTPFGPLWQLLKRNVVSRRIETLYELPARRLIQNPETAEIVGVAAEGRDGGTVNLKARRAVVMALGGFEFNQEMMKDYFIQGAPIFSIGTPSNTGDGIRMALAVGADLWHMSNVLAPSYDMHFPDAGLPLGQCMYFHAPGNSSIWVDQYGRRWRNDDPGRGPLSDYRHGKGVQEGLYHDRDGFYPRIPSHFVFDEDCRLSGPLQLLGADRKPHLARGYTQYFGDYVWSDDNRAEIERGWITTAASIAELAEKIRGDPDNQGRMEPEILQGTVTRYNQHCEAGSDREFSRAPATLAPIKRPPFYSVKLWARATNTQGGPRHNRFRQIMHAGGWVIPRLYSAGEFGSMWGWLYQGGGNLAECIASGRIAGEHAAGEQAWD